MHTLMDSRDDLSLSPGMPTPADDGRVLYVQGLLALRNGAAEEATALLTRALRRQPTNPGMRRNLVRALLLAEQHEQVVVQANAALAATPDDAELHFARGTALNALGQPARACAAFAQALSLQPGHAPSWLNMGNASADLDDLASAETLYRTAIRLDGGLPEAHASLAYILTMQGRLKEAIETCDAAIRLRPDFAEAHWNLAIATLLSGDLPRGFAEYEWRKRHAGYRADFPDLGGPPWDGTDPRGRTILVRAEQGFGDTIQFARYLKMISGAGGYPILQCASALVPLMQSMPGVLAVAPSAPLPPHDAWIDLASLPRVYGTTLETIPASEGYLTADPVRMDHWEARLPQGHKVGIAFAGNPRHSGDRRRSLPVEYAVAMTKVADMNFVNLQHGALAAGLGLPDLTSLMTDYAETAALIASLDLVITVDTSVAHLAGALGKPVWILLPHAPDWRWQLHRTDSPWYASARLFRQTKPGDWSGIIDQVGRELGAIGAHTGSPYEGRL